jgi:hypothetical protein
MNVAIGGLFGLVFLAFVVLCFAFWIWMLVDAIKNPKLDGTQRVVWVLVVLFLHVLGAAIYFFAGRQQS